MQVLIFHTSNLIHFLQIYEQMETKCFANTLKGFRELFNEYRFLLRKIMINFSQNLIQ
jgi:hypothetical protein